MAERWENAPRATSGMPDITVSGSTRAPLCGRLTRPATLAQGRMSQNVKGQKEEAHDLVQLAV